MNWAWEDISRTASWGLYLHSHQLINRGSWHRLSMNLSTNYWYLCLVAKLTLFPCGNKATFLFYFLQSPFEERLRILSFTEYYRLHLISLSLSLKACAYKLEEIEFLFIYSLFLPSDLRTFLRQIHRTTDDPSSDPNNKILLKEYHPSSNKKIIRSSYF